MLFFKRSVIHSDEMGLLFRDGEFRGVLEPGVHWMFDPFGKIRVDVASRRAPFLLHEKLDVIVRSGVLKGLAETIDLTDDQRALVWVDRRFLRILGPGLYVYWTGLRNVRVEIVDARTPRFEHQDIKAIVKNPSADAQLQTGAVGRGCVGVLFLDGRYTATLEPGPWAFWRGSADVRVVDVDLRETTIEIAGQEVMSADKVTLRLNALATFRVDDARKAVCASEDFKQALYREAQLALRNVVGARDFDTLLADKESVAIEAASLLVSRASLLGLEGVGLGIKDLILPGDMKELMNRVTEARKAAEADLITRREETAALRSQANTAKLLAENPTLMRMRELEILEKIATSGQLSIMLGEKGLADRVLKML